MAKTKADQHTFVDVLDYPESMSMYERESLAAEARLAVERKIKKRPKPAVKSKKLSAPRG
jgi:hypothetical protein